MANQFGCGEIPKKFTDYKTAAAVILPVPYEGTVSYGKGTAAAPEALIKASYFQEFYDDELECETYTKGIHTLAPLKAAKNPETMVNDVRKASAKILKDNKFPFMLGGEHSISYGLYLALKEKYPDLGVIQIDAHADLRDSYEDSKYSHAAVMRRIRETCKDTAQIAIRSICREEADYIKKEKAAVYFAREITGRTEWIKGMLKKLPKQIFLTFDIDGMDPSVVPHTGTPEPGGLSWYETLHILREIFKNKDVVGMDLVELSSDKTSRNSDFLAAKLAYRMLGYKFFL